MVTMVATVTPHKMTQDDNKEHKGSEYMRRDEISKGNNGKGNNGVEVNEHKQLVCKTDGGYKHKTPKDNNGETHAYGDEQWELEDSECMIYECEGLKLREDKVHELKELEYEPAHNNAEVGNGHTKHGKVTTMGYKSLEAVHGVWSCLACSLDRLCRLAVAMIILLGSWLPSLPNSPAPLHKMSLYTTLFTILTFFLLYSGLFVLPAGHLTKSPWLMSKMCLLYLV